MKLLIAGLALIALGTRSRRLHESQSGAAVHCRRDLRVGRGHSGGQFPDQGRVPAGSAAEAESLTHLANDSTAGDRVFDCSP